MTETRGDIYTRIEGPPNPLRENPVPLFVDMKIRPAPNAVILTVGAADLQVPLRQWSDWVGLDFKFMPFQSLHGMVRFYLVQGFPDMQLYMSPIQADPLDPALPITSPPGYAKELATRIGRYHTLGLAEETWSLNEGHLSDDAYLDMVATVYREREKMLFDTLQADDSRLVVTVFVQPDRVSHMFWRGIDPEWLLNKIYRKQYQRILIY